MTTGSRQAVDIGARFFRLTVVREAPARIDGRGRTLRMWLCRCDCGTERLVYESNLRKGNTLSCGCAKAQLRAESMRRLALGLIQPSKSTGRRRTGATLIPEYRVWEGLKQRCLNPRAKGARNYNHRGIGVCERWAQSFDAFYTDMGPRPTPKHSIDRIDNNRGYGPDNCRWATSHEQASNKRCSHVLTHNGETLTIRDWATRCGMHYNTLFMRLKYGWSIGKALTEPIRYRPRGVTPPAVARS